MTQCVNCKTARIRHCEGFQQLEKGTSANTNSTINLVQRCQSLHARKAHHDPKSTPTTRDSLSDVPLLTAWSMHAIHVWIVIVVARLSGATDCKLASAFIKMTVSVDAKSQQASVSSLMLATDPSNPSGSFTVNLLHPQSGADTISGTGLLLAATSQWAVPVFVSATSNFSCQPATNSASLTGLAIKNAQGAVVATEAWAIELQQPGDQIRWSVQRRYEQTISVLTDRTPALVWCTVGAPGCNVPGFFDVSMLLNSSTSAGFPIPTPAGMWETPSPSRGHVLTLSPSGLVLESQLSVPFFTFAKPFADGTAGIVALGGQTVDRTTGRAATRSKGESVSQVGISFLGHTSFCQVWTLRLGINKGVTSTFSLSLPGSLSELAALSNKFAIIHNLFQGFIFGNNPASVPCLHEMSWWPQLYGIYSSRLPFITDTDTDSDHLATNPGAGGIEKELRFMAAGGVRNDGFVYPRWSPAGGYYMVRWSVCSPVFLAMCHVCAGVHCMIRSRTSFSPRTFIS